jgi:hypothetical protein
MWTPTSVKAVGEIFKLVVPMNAVVTAGVEV